MGAGEAGGWTVVRVMHEAGQPCWAAGGRLPHGQAGASAAAKASQGPHCLRLACGVKVCMMRMPCRPAVLARQGVAGGRTCTAVSLNRKAAAAAAAAGARFARSRFEQARPPSRRPPTAATHPLQTARGCGHPAWQRPTGSWRGSAGEGGGGGGKGVEMQAAHSACRLSPWPSPPPSSAGAGPALHLGRELWHAHHGGVRKVLREQGAGGSQEGSKAAGGGGGCRRADSRDGPRGLQEPNETQGAPLRPALNHSPAAGLPLGSYPGWQRPRPGRQWGQGAVAQGGCWWRQPGKEGRGAPGGGCKRASHGMRR